MLLYGWAELDQANVADGHYCKTEAEIMAELREDLLEACHELDEACDTYERYQTDHNRANMVKASEQVIMLDAKIRAARRIYLEMPATDCRSVAEVEQERMSVFSGGFLNE